MIKVLLWLRQLPQETLGIILAKLVWKNKLDTSVSAKDLKHLHGLEKIVAKKNYIVKESRLPYLCSFSLGVRVFLKKDSLHDTKAIRHECVGHSVQSRRYGWFYLPVVGLVSAMRNLYQRKYDKPSAWYYGGFPEKQADVLGGVKRCFIN